MEPDTKSDQNVVCTYVCVCVGGGGGGGERDMNSREKWTDISLAHPGDLDLHLFCHRSISMWCSRGTKIGVGIETEGKSERGMLTSTSRWL